MVNPSYFYLLSLLSLRYAIVAGITFLIFYILYPKKLFRIKIQKIPPKKVDLVREISFSFLSISIITVILYSIWTPGIRPHTRLYSHIAEYGWVYFFASIFFALLIHDTYFYWAHRLMHHPKLFKIFHLVHHRSTNPTPWAAYAFHPLEAAVEGFVIWIIVFTIPIHPIATAIFTLLMIAQNVFGHSGYEIYPKWLINSRIGKWLNTSTNHNMHHKYFNDNYGLYFRFWDEIMKTTNPKYKETIDEILSKDINKEQKEQ
jgi:Delta7-sterol 5-desaturase